MAGMYRGHDYIANWRPRQTFLTGYYSRLLSQASDRRYNIAVDTHVDINIDILND